MNAIVDCGKNRPEGGFRVYRYRSDIQLTSKTGIRR
jgi:hypothetical protein